MNLYLFEINSTHYNVLEREKYYNENQDFMRFSLLKKKNLISEIIFLKTCHRLAYYVVSSLSKEHLLSLLFQDELVIKKTNFLNFLQIKQGNEVVLSIFRLVSGLDSPIIGENEIVSQVKKSYKDFFEKGLTGPYLNKIFQRAFYVSKKIRTETQISRNSLSMFGIILDELKSFHRSNLDLDIPVLLIGAGSLGKTMAHRFHKKGFTNLTITSRTFSNYYSLASVLNFENMSLNELLLKGMHEYKVILSCMSSSSFIFSAKNFEAKQKRDSLIVFDLGMPRNFSPDIQEYDDIRLCNIDEILKKGSLNYKLREQHIQMAESLIKKELTDFKLKQHTNIHQVFR